MNFRAGDIEKHGLAAAARSLRTDAGAAENGATHEEQYKDRHEDRNEAKNEVFRIAEERAGRERMATRLRRMWGERRTVARMTLAGFAVAAAVAFVIPRQYQASAHLMPPDQSSSGNAMAMLAASSGTAGSGLGALAGDLLGLKSSGALFIGILQSRAVQDSIVNRFELQKVYGDRFPEGARKDLAAHSDLFEDRKSGIITIQVTDSDPRRAAAIAQAYTEQLNRVVNQMSTSSAHREREFLEERLGMVQTELETDERELSQFSSKNGAIDIQAQGKAMIDGAASLQGQLIGVESELQGLKQIYTDDNIRVRSLRAELAELKDQLARIGGTDTNFSATSGSNTAKANAAPKDSLDYPSIRKLPLLGVAFGDLYRRAKVQEAVFETLTREYELAKVEEVKETPSVKVLDAASIPNEKSFPPRLLIISAGTLAGLIAGLLWMVLRMLWKETDPDDPCRELVLEIYRDTTAKMSLPAIGGALTSLAHRNGKGASLKHASQEHD